MEDNLFHSNTAMAHIRRVNVNIAATTVEELPHAQRSRASAHTFCSRKRITKRVTRSCIPTGPKRDYDWHTEAMDRAMEGGIDDVGLWVYCLDSQGYRYEFAGLIMHAEHLEAVHGVGPHTISVPRVKPADGY